MVTGVSLSVLHARLWNELPQNLTSLDCTASFKKGLKTWLFGKFLTAKVLRSAIYTNFLYYYYYYIHTAFANVRQRKSIVRCCCAVQRPVFRRSLYQLMHMKCPRKYRSPKVTSLVARSSRGRCAQHLHDTRAMTRNICVACARRMRVMATSTNPT
jgi:hypothetical protein